MIPRWLLTAAILGCAVSAWSAPTPETSSSAPFLIARLQPVEKLFDDAKYLASKFGTPEAAATFQSKVLRQIGADSIAEMGIDPKKPVGFYSFSQEESIEPAVVFMLPVASEKSILDFVGKHEVKAEKLEDSLYSLAIPDHALPVFVRFADNYAYVTPSNKAAVAVATLLAPARAFVAEETAALAVTIRPDQISEGMRKLVLAQVGDYIKESLSEFDEDDDFPDLTEAQAKATIRWVELICEGGREVTLRASYDRPTGELVFDTAVQPKAGSKLAEAVAAIKSGASLFTKMLGERGAINCFGNWGMDAEEAKEVATFVNDTVGEMLMEWLGIDDTDDKSKAEINEFCKVLVPTAETREIDMAMSLRAVGDKYVLLGGTRLKDGRKIEEALRKLIAAIPEDQRNKVTLDAQTVGNIKLHQIEFEDEDDEDERIFGKGAKRWVAIKDDAAVFALGVDADKAVAEAIAEAAAAPAPNFQFDVSVKKLKNFAEVFWDDIFPELGGFFGQDADRVRILAVGVDGGQQLKVRVSINLQMMVGIALAGDELDEDAAAPAMPAAPVALAQKPED